MQGRDTATAGTATRAADKFARAARHSRFVRRLRWGLPMLVVVCAGVFVSTSIVRSLVQDVQIGDIQLRGTTLIMNSPRLSGFDTNRRPYELTAERAEQDVTTPRRIHLHRLDARMDIAANGRVRVTADRGFYNGEVETFRAEGNVHVTSTLGYEMFLSEADVDVRRNTIVSQRPVEARQGQNRLFGDRMNATNGGEVVIFEGNVRVIYHQAEQEAGQ